MSLHSNFQPRKPGLVDLKIIDDKMRAKPGKDAFGYLYGSRQYRKAFLEAMDNRSNQIDVLLSGHLHYSDRGDFTRCYRGGF